MKVRELIAALQLENPESNVRVLRKTSGPARGIYYDVLYEPRMAGTQSDALRQYVIIEAWDIVDPKLSTINHQPPTNT